MSSRYGEASHRGRTVLIGGQAATQNMTSSKCYYEIVPKEHWSLPDWIDEGRFMNSLEYLGAIGVGKGWMISYRHMCRWNSGFFYKHPRLKDFDWYWRVEPDVCSCDSAPAVQTDMGSARFISSAMLTTTCSALCVITTSSMVST